MPAYEYRCEKGCEYTEVERMSDEPHRECVKCGAPVERVMSASMVRVKGGTPIHHSRAPRR